MKQHLTAVESCDIYDAIRGTRLMGRQTEFWAVCECGWDGRTDDGGGIFAAESDATENGYKHAEEATADDMASACDAAYDRGREEGWGR